MARKPYTPMTENFLCESKEQDTCNPADRFNRAMVSNKEGNSISQQYDGLYAPAIVYRENTVVDSGDESIEVVVGETAEPDKFRKFSVKAKLSNEIGNKLQLKDDGLFVKVDTVVFPENPVISLTEAFLQQNLLEINKSNLVYSANRSVCFMADSITTIIIGAYPISSYFDEIFFVRESGLLLPLRIEWPFGVTVNNIAGPNFQIYEPGTYLHIIRKENQKWVSMMNVGSVQSNIEYVRSWAEGTLPGGAGTYSAKEYAIQTGLFRDQVAADALDTAADRMAVTASATAAAASATQAALYEGIWLDDAAAVLANTNLAYSAAPGKTVVAVGSYLRTRKEGFAYQVVASAATDNDVVMAGGVKLYVLAGPRGNAAAAAFGDNLALADAYFRRSPFGKVELSAGQTYTITTDVHLPRVFCTGMATVVVNGGSLNYNHVAATDRIDFEGVNFVVVGARRGEDVAGSTPLYVGETLVQSARMERCTMTALTDVNVPTSWSDDAGKTRHTGFIRYITDESYINDVHHFGFGMFAAITPATVAADHFERNVHGKNCQTGIWLRAGSPAVVAATGHSENNSIINTLAQQGYWIGKGIGALENGMDTILCEVDHSVKYTVRNILGYYAIERSVYLQSGNMDVDGLTDYKGLSTANIKGMVFAQNNRVRNVINTAKTTTVAAAGSFGANAQSGLTLDGYVQRAETWADIRGLIIGGTTTGDIYKFRGGLIENLANGFYIIGSGSIAELHIDGAVLSEVRALSGAANVLEYRDGDTITVADLRLSNIKHRLKTPQDYATTGMAATAYRLRNTTKVNMIGCEGWARSAPWDISGATTIECFDSRFSVQVDNTFLIGFNRLRDFSNFVGTDFDFVVDVYASNRATLNQAVSVRMARRQHATPVNCADNWVSIDAGLTLATNAVVFTELFDIRSTSFFVTARLGDSLLKFFYDHPTTTTTVMQTAGTRLSNTDLSKFRISIASGALLIRTISTILPGGDLRIVVER